MRTFGYICSRIGTLTWWNLFVFLTDKRVILMWLKCYTLFRTIGNTLMQKLLFVEWPCLIKNENTFSKVFTYNTYVLSAHASNRRLLFVRKLTHYFCIFSTKTKVSTTNVNDIIKQWSSVNPDGCVLSEIEQIITKSGLTNPGYGEMSLCMYIQAYSAVLVRNVEFPD